MPKHTARTKHRTDELHDAMESVKYRHPTACCKQVVKTWTVFYAVQYRPKGKVIATAASARRAWLNAAKVVDQ